mmetsp:Transcript_22873/g.28179  ORF Transcript_22873/g.28179 Transcript_22873/m.28179 type:complete len:87 (-) Transcript_22873:123-383(-)
MSFCLATFNIKNDFRHSTALGHTLRRLMRGPATFPPNCENMLPYSELTDSVDAQVCREMKNRIANFHTKLDAMFSRFFQQNPPSDP